MKDVGSFLLILLALTACALAFDEYRDRHPGCPRDRSGEDPCRLR